MQYSMEELVPIVAMLTDKYTGKESTSITYEKAQQFMNAVIYCINEWSRSQKASSDNSKKEQAALVESTQKPSAKRAYEFGYHMIIQKVKNALKLYNDIMSDFDSYGIRSLEDTMIKGIPEFFKWYDAQFEPQNTILTLDYPVPLDLSKVCGVDAIYRYLKLIKNEQEYLKQFSREEVIIKLSAYHPQYEDLFENITEMIGGRHTI